MDNTVLVVIPTYNERDNLEGVVARVHQAVPTARVLVVDDASPDGTGAVADDMAQRDGRIEVLHRSAKEGLGEAYKAGLGKGLADGYQVLVEMDADGSHLPEQLPQLLGALGHADLVLGSRWVPGGEVRNWAWRRRALSRAGNTYAGALLGIRVKDATSGFRAFRHDALVALDLKGVSSQGYCFQVDMVRRAAAAGMRVVEVPITFVEREHGVSKMSGAIVRESLARITAWGLERRLHQVRDLLGR